MYEEYDVVDPEVAFSRSLMGKECQACRRVLHYKFYDNDSTSRDGKALICPKCKATPRLSAAENLSRLQEANFSSDAVSRQRRDNEEDYMERDYQGRVLYSWSFVSKLKDAGIKVICAPAAFMNEISLYVDRSQGTETPHYLGWIPIGAIPEFSTYKYNEYAVPIDEVEHGYRGILKNLIVLRLLTEEKCERFFGSCTDKVWSRSMWELRNPGKTFVE